MVFQLLLLCPHFVVLPRGFSDHPIFSICAAVVSTFLTTLTFRLDPLLSPYSIFLHWTSATQCSDI